MSACNIFNTTHSGQVLNDSLESIQAELVNDMISDNMLFDKMNYINVNTAKENNIGFLRDFSKTILNHDSVHIVTFEEANKIYKNKFKENLPNNAKSFVIREGVYLIKDRMNEEDIIEEHIHLFVKKFKKEHLNHYEQLLQRFKIEFKEEYNRVITNYSNIQSYTTDSIDEEFFTKVLLKNWSNIKKKTWIERFVDYVIDIFNTLLLPFNKHITWTGTPIRWLRYHMQDFEDGVYIDENAHIDLIEENEVFFSLHIDASSNSPYNPTKFFKDITQQKNPTGNINYNNEIQYNIYTGTYSETKTTQYASYEEMRKKYEQYADELKLIEDYLKINKVSRIVLNDINGKLSKTTSNKDVYNLSILGAYLHDINKIFSHTNIAITSLSEIYPQIFGKEQIQEAFNKEFEELRKIAIYRDSVETYSIFHNAYYLYLLVTKVSDKSYRSYLRNTYGDNIASIVYLNMIATILHLNDMLFSGSMNIDSLIDEIENLYFQNIDSKEGLSTNYKKQLKEAHSKINKEVKDILKKVRTTIATLETDGDFNDFIIESIADFFTTVIQEGYDVQLEELKNLMIDQVQKDSSLTDKQKTKVINSIKEKFDYRSLIISQLKLLNEFESVTQTASGKRHSVLSRLLSFISPVGNTGYIPVDILYRIFNEATSKEGVRFDEFVLQLNKLYTKHNIDQSPTNQSTFFENKTELKKVKDATEETNWEEEYRVEISTWFNKMYDEIDQWNGVIRDVWGFLSEKGTDSNITEDIINHLKKYKLLNGKSILEAIFDKYVISKEDDKFVVQFKDNKVNFKLDLTYGVLFNIITLENALLKYENYHNKYIDDVYSSIPYMADGTLEGFLAWYAKQQNKIFSNEPIAANFVLPEGVDPSEEVMKFFSMIIDESISISRDTDAYVDFTKKYLPELHINGIRIGDMVPYVKNINFYEKIKEIMTYKSYEYSIAKLSDLKVTDPLSSINTYANNIEQSKDFTLEINAFFYRFNRDHYVNSNTPLNYIYKSLHDKVLSKILKDSKNVDKNLIEEIKKFNTVLKEYFGVLDKFGKTLNNYNFTDSELVKNAIGDMEGYINSTWNKVIKNLLKNIDLKKEDISVKLTIENIKDKSNINDIVQVLLHGLVNEGFLDKDFYNDSTFFVSLNKTLLDASHSMFNALFDDSSETFAYNQFLGAFKVLFPNAKPNKELYFLFLKSVSDTVIKYYSFKDINASDTRFISKVIETFTKNLYHILFQTHGYFPGLRINETLNDDEISVAFNMMHLATVPLGDFSKSYEERIREIAASNNPLDYSFLIYDPEIQDFDSDDMFKQVKQHFSEGKKSKAFFEPVNEQDISLSLLISQKVSDSLKGHTEIPYYFNIPYFHNNDELTVNTKRKYNPETKSYSDDLEMVMNYVNSYMEKLKPDFKRFVSVEEFKRYYLDNTDYDSLSSVERKAVLYLQYVFKMEFHFAGDTYKPPVFRNAVLNDMFFKEDMDYIYKNGQLIEAKTKEIAGITIDAVGNWLPKRYNADGKESPKTKKIINTYSGDKYKLLEDNEKAFMDDFTALYLREQLNGIPHPYRRNIEFPTILKRTQDALLENVKSKSVKSVFGVLNIMWENFKGTRSEQLQNTYYINNDKQEATGRYISKISSVLAPFPIIGKHTIRAKNREEAEKKYKHVSFNGYDAVLQYIQSGYNSRVRFALSGAIENLKFLGSKTIQGQKKVFSGLAKLMETYIMRTQHGKEFVNTTKASADSRAYKLSTIITKILRNKFFFFNTVSAMKNLIMFRAMINTELRKVVYSIEAKYGNKVKISYLGLKGVNPQTQLSSTKYYLQSITNELSTDKKEGLNLANQILFLFNPTGANIAEIGTEILTTNIKVEALNPNNYVFFLKNVTETTPVMRELFMFLSHIKVARKSNPQEYVSLLSAFRLDNNGVITTDKDIDDDFRIYRDDKGNIIIGKGLYDIIIGFRNSITNTTGTTLGDARPLFLSLHWALRASTYIFNTILVIYRTRFGFTLDPHGEISVRQSTTHNSLALGYLGGMYLLMKQMKYLWLRKVGSPESADEYLIRNTYSLFLFKTIKEGLFNRDRKNPNVNRMIKNMAIMLMADIMVGILIHHLFKNLLLYMLGFGDGDEPDDSEILKAMRKLSGPMPIVSYEGAEEFDLNGYIMQQMATAIISTDQELLTSYPYYRNIDNPLLSVAFGQVNPIVEILQDVKESQYALGFIVDAYNFSTKLATGERYRRNVGNISLTRKGEKKWKWTGLKLVMPASSIFDPTYRSQMTLKNFDWVKSNKKLKEEAEEQ